MNKSLMKVTAIAVCFVFLLLAFPGSIEARPRTTRYYFQKMVLRPLAMFAEFFSFLPFYDIPAVDYDYADNVDSEPATEYFSSKMKITGGLSSHRLSEED